MKISGQSDFPYQFYIENENSSSFSTQNNMEGTRDEIIKWCSMNCKSRWIMTTVTNVSVFAPLSFENPISNKKFPAAKMEEYSKIVLMFEDETEATGFKMTFIGK